MLLWGFELLQAALFVIFYSNYETDNFWHVELMAKVHWIFRRHKYMSEQVYLSAQPLLCDLCSKDTSLSDEIGPN